jgi:hypothetical protein
MIRCAWPRLEPQQDLPASALQKMNTPEHQYVGPLLHDRISGAIELCCRRGERCSFRTSGCAQTTDFLNCLTSRLAMQVHQARFPGRCLYAGHESLLQSNHVTRPLPEVWAPGGAGGRQFLHGSNGPLPGVFPRLRGRNRRAPGAGPPPTAPAAWRARSQQRLSRTHWSTSRAARGTKPAVHARRVASGAAREGGHSNHERHGRTAAPAGRHQHLAISRWLLDRSHPRPDEGCAALGLYRCNAKPAGSVPPGVRARAGTQGVVLRRPRKRSGGLRRDLTSLRREECYGSEGLIVLGTDRPTDCSWAG